MSEPMIFLDTETCGLHGPIVLLQYAIGDGDVQLYNPWHHTPRETIELFEMIANHPGGICGFNVAFDWFHIYQMWSVLKLLPYQEEELSSQIDEYAILEAAGRNAPCLKPVKVCDVMIHARKGPYQSTMDRGDIRIRRVPTTLAFELANELDSRIKISDIYFAKKKNKKGNKKHWQVFDIKNSDEEVNPDFKDIVLKFAPSAALKALAHDALGIEQDAILLFRDIEVSREYLPKEAGYAPFATAIGEPGNWHGAWPAVISHHIYHWELDQLAREYAKKDVIYTRDLWKKFGCPEPGDDDSELTACVACVRWRGYKINVPGIQKLRQTAYEKKFFKNPDGSIKKDGDGQPVLIPTEYKKVRYYISELMSPMERATSTGKDFEVSTKRVLLETIAKWKKTCDCCATTQKKIEVTTDMSYQDMITAMQSQSKDPDPDCLICEGKGTYPHPAGVRAKEVLGARTGNKEIEMWDKLLLAGRFHASFKVIGALTSRMSGTDKLNAQGIKNDINVRSQFPLAFDGMQLCGGDFSGFEVTLAEASYNDPELRKDLLTCEYCEGMMVIKDGDIFCEDCVIREGKKTSDKKCKKCQKMKVYSIPKKGSDSEIYCPDCDRDGKAIHALFGVNVFPDMTYKQIKVTKGQPDDKYTRCKQAVFAMFYGGVDHTLQDRLGVDIAIAREAIKRFHRRYPGVAKSQQAIADAFQAMKQPGGLGSRVVWNEPAQYIESMFGFRRYFTLENEICKALFTLANSPPQEWSKIKIKVVRRDRQQTVGGALQSSLYGAAFQIQAGNDRAARNHVIQSSGATITKAVQRKIWDLQPSGPAGWRVQPCNIHDEILCPTAPEYASQVKTIVNQSVESFRPKVPLIKMEWKSDLRTWGDK